MSVTPATGFALSASITHTARQIPMPSAQLATPRPTTVKPTSMSPIQHVSAMRMARSLYRSWLVAAARPMQTAPLAPPVSCSIPPTITIFAAGTSAFLIKQLLSSQSVASRHQSNDIVSSPLGEQLQCFLDRKHLVVLNSPVIIAHDFEHALWIQ